MSFVLHQKLNQIHLLGNKHALGKRKSVEWREAQSLRLKAQWNNGVRKLAGCAGLLKEKHWNWKGGKSKNRHVGSKYEAWRTKVFSRDNWTCQRCWLRGVFLEAHHIKFWSTHPKLRYIVSNGVTLCRKCHRLAHKKCL